MTMVDTSSGWRVLTRTLFGLAWPQAATYLIQVTVQTGGMLFVGRLGDPKYLGAAALGNMMAHLTGFSIGLGMTTALEALCSQAFGAKKYSLVGLHAQRACAILTLCCFPLALIWLQTATVLGWIGIESETAALAGRWTRTLIVGMWPYLMFESMRRYLQGQRVVWPMVVAAAIVSPINVMLNYLLVYQADMGYIGAALSTALTNWNLLITLVLLIKGRLWYRRRKRDARRTQRQYQHVAIELETRVNVNGANGTIAGNGIAANDNDSSSLSTVAIDDDSAGSRLIVSTNDSANVDIDTNDDRNKTHVVTNDTNTTATPSNPVIDDDEEERQDNTWPALSRDVLRGWKQFAVLGIPGSISLFLEWGSYEVSASIAGRLGTIPLAVHTVFMQTASVWYMIPMGFATATSTMIGNALGSGQTRDPSTLAKIGVVIVAIYGVVNGLFYLIALRRPWVSLFSSDPDVIAAAYDQLPIMWLYGFWDATKAMTMMILRGTGRPQVTVAGNFISCAAVAYPLAFGLAASIDFPLWGLWSCMSLAWMVATLIYGVIIYRTDWQKEAEKAKARTLAAEAHTAITNGTTDSNSDVTTNMTAITTHGSNDDDTNSVAAAHVALPDDDTISTTAIHSTSSQRQSSSVGSPMNVRLMNGSNVQPFSDNDSDRSPSSSISLSPGRDSANSNSNSNGYAYGDRSTSPIAIIPASSPQSDYDSDQP